MTANVKYFSSTMLNAPVVGNNWGDLVTMLDACLVTGFNQKTVLSASYDGTDVVLQLATGHGFVVHQVLLLAGANEAVYRGEFRVKKVEPERVFLSASDAMPAQATGTITAKVAPLDFEIVFSGDQKRAYRSKNLQSERAFLRVDNGCPQGYTTTWRKFARVNVAENMRDIDSFDGAVCPMDSTGWTGATPKGTGSNMVSGWAKWYQTCAIGSYSREADASQQAMAQWILVGDDRGFYISFLSQTAYDSYVCGFNELNHLGAAGSKTVLIAAMYAGTVGSGYTSDQNNFGRYGNYSSCFALKPYHGVGSSAALYVAGMFFSSQNITVQYGTGTVSTSSGALTVPAPNPVDYGYFGFDVWLYEQNLAVRGVLAGVLFTPQAMPLNHADIVSNVDGRRLLAVKVQFSGNQGMMFLDLSDKWARI